MLMISAKIEAALISKLSEALTTASVSCRVGGAWQPPQSGLVKWCESDVSAPAFLNVSVGTPSHATFSDPTVSVPASITLFVRYELDPSGSILDAAAAAVQALLDTWQESTYQQPFTALDLPSFNVGDLSVSSGESPSVDLTNHLVSVSWSLSLAGCYPATASTSTTTT